jgi:hypothetical protein
MQGRNLRRRAGQVATSATRLDSEPRISTDKAPPKTSADLVTLSDAKPPANDPGHESGAVALPPPERKAAE